ncbi:sodium transport system permease protein [Marinimicrobium koreense]|uniref:Sodium transport system permease protein n=1 Tax=Marinimicrobium koreense TaxID=306545 RepID=A0A3N1NW69_9GAMM|nr:ABC transporter permease [Marinimicrobium koreense]ROQ20425.1 sodium transport system permease protein [Marinimicrobium koreense]
MKSFWVILLKEIRDNLRDRRSMFFTLLYGPLLLPALMIGPLVFNVNKFSVDTEQPLSVAVVGRERAPNLMAFLAEHNINTETTEEDFIEPLRRGELPLVMEIPEDYEPALRNARPAPVVIHYHSGGDDATQQRRRLRAVLDGYDSRLRSLRFLARGMDEQVFDPLHISERDVSTQVPGEAFMGLILPFMLLFSMMMGGFYLAVDTTAGERERLSLEPLLALPVPRWQLVLGKYVAILAFVLMSLILPLISGFVLFGLLDDGVFTSRYDFSASTFVAAAFLHLPVALLMTAFLFVIAAFARSTKEAQTQLGIAMLVPMLPFFLLQFLNIPEQSLTMAIPLLGQYQLMTQLVNGQSIVPVHWVLSSASCVALAVLLMSMAVRRYRHESILQ